MPHHYDAHDQDKLQRWHNELRATPIPPDGFAPGGFPVMALFLVKPEAAGAHEIFRRYRAEFEARDAAFAQLVVFGMHGVSAAVRSLLGLAGLAEGDLPALLLAPASDPADVVAIRLPPGESLEGGDDPNGDGTCDYLAPWQDALDRIRITRYGARLRLAGVQGRPMPGVDLTRLADAALAGTPPA